jgi:uncharacterized membrane protein YgaE (UPF0421/DUF939 family)
MKALYRPKNNYLLEASMEDLRQINLNWKSEVEFMEDEIRVFEDLIDRYFPKLTDLDHIEKVRQIVDKLIHLRDHELKKIKEQIIKHEFHIEQVLANKIADEESFRKEHNQLEDKISALRTDFIGLKKELFTILDEVIKKDKQQHLLKD